MNRLAETLAPDDSRDAVRKLGGLLLGIGLLTWYLRRSGLADSGNFGLFVILGVTTAFLYGFGLAGYASVAERRPWQSVYAVFGLLIAPLALLHFILWIDDTPDFSWVTFLVFLVAAGLAIGAWQAARVRYSLLLASIFAILAWSGLWDKILSDGIFENVTAYRWLLLLLAVGLLAASLPLTAEGDEEGGDPGSEVITGAGIAAVLGLGLSVSALGGLTAGLVTTFEVPAEPNVFWDALLLIVSVALVMYGSRVGARGPVYIGAIGLFIFILVVGLDLDSDTPDPKLFGWPLLLIALGLIAFIGSLSGAAGGSLPGRGGGGAAAAPPPSPPPPGGATEPPGAGGAETGPSGAPSEPGRPPGT